MIQDLPRLLADFEPAAARFREDYSDFEVDEIPLYPAAGDGTHVYFLLEKRGLGTMQAVGDLATHLGVRRMDIGYAGLKDSRAVTRQWMSIEHVEPDRVRAIEIPRMRVLDVTRHRNKIKIGHLWGNRFVIRARGADSARLPGLTEALALLSRRGVPNYYGPQRFGGRGDGWRVGRAILLGKLDEALDWVLGKPGPGDHGDIRKGREAYEAGRYDDAARRWPGMFHDERRALKILSRTGVKKRAFLSINESMRRFYVSAYQSYLFNQVAARRMATGRWSLEQGDLAWLTRNGAVFRVEDLAAELPRFESGEISPTGPLFGYRMTRPEGAADELEQSLLAAEELSEGAFKSGRVRVSGGRRPLRFLPVDARISLGADGRGAYLELGFSLPAGCYATALLRELFAEPPDEAAADSDDSTGS